MTQGTESRRFVLIGAGAAARALGLAMRAAGFEAAAVVGRDLARADRLAKELGTSALGASEADRDAVLWCLCVPDGAIRSVADGLARDGEDWSGRTVLHVSGAHDASPLGAVAGLGAVTLAFHPVQTFTSLSDSHSLDGICVGISGDEKGRGAGLDLADRLGLRPVIVEDADRPLYHLATTLVSNGVVTLSAMAHEVLASTGIGATEARRLLAPLVMASASNLVDGTPESVLTGPVSRGDAGTVESHLDRLSQSGPHLVPTVAALTTETVRLAMRSGRLDAVAAERILEIISRFLGYEDSFLDEMEP